jgi:hypothetical protein
MRCNLFATAFDSVLAWLVLYERSLALVLRYQEIGSQTFTFLSRSLVFNMSRRTFTALNSTFVVDAEYEFVKELGQGAYGCVVSARHRRSGEGCAIKKITNINTKVCKTEGMSVIWSNGYSLSVSSPSDA